VGPGGAPNEKGAEQVPKNESLSDRLKLMQKNMMILQKKEAYSKRMLYES
jgi:hypothetical protein